MMSVLTVIILIFSLLGAVDLIIGNKLGVGKEFERAFTLFCPMALSMLGMIVIAPAVGVWLNPVFEWFYSVFGIDPSIIPASILANDMGGAPLAQSVCVSAEIGGYNAYIISAMMGCVISFTIPFSLGIVKKEQHKELFFGLLCGIVTIPIGSFVAGLICGLSPLVILIDLLPLIIISVIVGLGLVFLPSICIKCFRVLGLLIKTVSIVGLVCAVFTVLTNIEISPHFDSFENAALVCATACVTFSGALPLMYVITKLLGKPIGRLGKAVGINSVSAVSLLGSLVTNATTFGVMDKMNKKGVVINSAFAVSASFMLGCHLAYTMTCDASYVAPMIVGKLISGICAVVLAALIYKGDEEKQEA